MARKVYIIAATRTPVSPVGGSLRNLSVQKMAASVLKVNLDRLVLPITHVEDVIISNALSGGGNIARLCTLETGFENTLLGSTIDRQCVGGLDAVIQAKKRVENENAKLLLAGGVESFSLRPDRLYRTSWKGETLKLERPLFYPHDNTKLAVGETVIKLKKEFGISDLEEFEWARLSHNKSLKNQVNHQREMCSIKGIPSQDSYARKISYEMFLKSQKTFGNFHPCNTAPQADGAAFLTIVSENILNRIAPKAFLEILDGFTLAGDPEYFPIAPVQALKQLLSRNKLRWKDITQLELMEAFATQAILCAKLSGASFEIINPLGGALSYGHPIGASGAILGTRLFYTLENNGDLGIASIAGVGGLVSVLLVKKITN